jgi:hypothetical protein
MLDDLSTGERAPGVFEKRLALPGWLLERRELPSNEHQIQRSEHLEPFGRSVRRYSYKSIS